MEGSTTKAKKPQNEPSDQPYVEVSQVDDDSGAGGQQREDIELGPVSGDDSHEESKNARPPEPEGTPVVLGTSAQLWTSLVHLLPLAISVVLITINVQRWYWFHEDNREVSMWNQTDINGIRNVLQLAAKVYELLVIASLGALTLKVFKRRLVESHLSLGLLTGAYRVGDVPYIFSGRFWMALGESGSGGLLLLVFVNTILATLVGPASAILLVPELDWYAFPDAFGNAEPPVFFYNSTINQTWPRVLSATEDRDGRLHNCTTFTGWFAHGCPSAGFADLYKWLTEWHSSGLSNDLVIQDPTGAVSRRLATTEVGLRKTVVMTTVSMPPLLTTGRLLNFMKWDDMGEALHNELNPPKFRLKASTDSTIFQPVVQSQCAVYTRAGPSPEPSPRFESDQLMCLGDPVCKKMRESRLIGGEADWNITRVEMSAYMMAPNASENHPLVAAATFPYRNGSSVGVLRFACTMMAHWMPATFSVSPAENDLVQSNVTDLISNAVADFYHLDLSTISVGPAIRIEEDWVEKYLLPKVNVTGPQGTTELTPLRVIFDPLLMQDSVVLEDGTEVRVLAAAGDQGSDNSSENYMALGRARAHVQKVFTGIVTEGLARYASGAESYVVRSYNDTAVVMSNIGTEHETRDGTVGVEFFDRLSTLTRFKFEVEKYGYGSGKVGPTLNFALAVIYIYLIVVGSYFLYAMVVSKLWLKSDVPTVGPWNDVAELLLLAWNSKSSPALSRSSVAVDRSRWPVQVGIRAEATGRAHLVTSNQGVERLRRNELYY
ncbi:hypothetical protein C8A01DRAFT_42302 [Parachaetomium inaequale]|uniref:Uncharacterized protein n=1 Tax=Parachaetomium inaequale TaxID=2588326 RepID=A0AAN6SL83_9PEZI|nr:hypothetical protein C8A01DRAFT_42302 [Parachaetomium inaequale]